MGIRKRRRDKEEAEKSVWCIARHRTGEWRAVAKGVGLNRNGKSCMKRWKSCKDPDRMGGGIAVVEELEIIHLRNIYGNSCAKMASEMKAHRTASAKYFPRHYRVDTNFTDATAVARAVDNKWGTDALAGNGGQQALLSSYTATNAKTLDEWTEEVVKLDELIEEMVELPHRWGDTGTRKHFPSWRWECFLVGSVSGDSGPMTYM